MPARDPVAAPAPVLRFLFDFISPYAYLGWIQLRAVADRTGAEVEPVPVLFAAMLNHHGHKGPAEIPPKRLFTFKDVVRRAARLGVPLVPPPGHPFNPLLALRAVAATAPAQRTAAIDALFASAWGGAEPRGVETPSAVREALDRAGLDGAAIVAAAAEDAVKNRVRADTDAAIAAGAFGVPAVLVGSELFWGTDSFEDIVDHLAGNDPATPERLAQWAQLPVSQSRRAPS
jgi:2-hydroxychromene-2-carboxylate isomerase